MRISDWSSDVCSSDLRTVDQAMIERLEPDPDLLVRHDGGSFVERATGFAAGCAKPRGNNDLPMQTSRLRQYPEQKNEPVTRSARLENRHREGWPLALCPEALR